MSLSGTSHLTVLEGINPTTHSGVLRPGPVSRPLQTTMAESEHEREHPEFSVPHRPAIARISN